MREHTIRGVAFFILLLIAGCGGDGGNDPTYPGAWNDELLQSTPSQPSEDTNNSDIDGPDYPVDTTVIVTVGDSLTYGIRSPIGGYPAILQMKLNEAGYNALVINKGVPGLTSPVAHDDMLEYIAGADITLIMIGTNDLRNPGGCPDRFNCRTVENTEAMLDKALISGVTPLISTVTPAKSTGINNWANPVISWHNEVIYSLANERNVIVVDNYTAILENGGDALFEDEKVHFTDEGYEVIARYFFNALVQNNLVEKVSP